MAAYRASVTATEAAHADARTPRGPEAGVRTAGVRTAGWAVRALLLLAVAAGLVLMHHVVGAHQHAPDQPLMAHSSAAHAASTSGLVGPIAESAATAALPVEAPAPAAAPAPGDRVSAAALHVHHDQSGHGDMAAVLHMCLAVLAAALALAFAHHFVGRRHNLERERLQHNVRRLRRSRPPLPVPLMLAHLQVLRL